jgi:Mn2+/Fe2+ NRAMP family transporter
MKRALIICGGCLSALLVLFLGTDPNKVPSFVLVFPFILLFVTLLSLAFILLQKRGMAVSRSMRIGALCAAVPIILLILQSIGQLTLKDVLTIGALFVVSYFYMSRLSTSS